MRQNGCQRKTIRHSERKVEFQQTSSCFLVGFQLSIFCFSNLFFDKYFAKNQKKKIERSSILINNFWQLFSISTFPVYAFAKHFSSFDFRQLFSILTFPVYAFSKHFSSFDFRQQFSIFYFSATTFYSNFSSFDFLFVAFLQTLFSEMFCETIFQNFIQFSIFTFQKVD